MFTNPQIIKTLEEHVQYSLGMNGSLTSELLSKGLSGSEIIKIHASEKTYVVRLWNMQWIDYFPQDLACQLIASDAGYGPKVYFSDQEKGITIMEYHFPENLPEIRIRLQALVDLVKKIHHGPLVPQGIDRAFYLDSLIEEIKESSFFDLETLKTIKNTVFNCTRASAKYVPCHRDLHHGNLLYNEGKFLAIDYTWGAMDDPYSDLANIAIFNCNNLEEERLLLELYLEHTPNPMEIARLSLMKLPAKIFYGLEFLGIATANMTYDPHPQIIPKSYMNFGYNGNTDPNASDLLNYAISLLSEVIDYSNSKQYIDDLKIIDSQ